jgi:hypothetical protein
MLRKLSNKEILISGIKYHTRGKTMKYRYNVYCWIYPQSGFDVRETNMLLNDFKDLVLRIFTNKAKALKALDRLLKSGEGKIINMVTLESDKPITDAEKELFPEIKKIYPEAIFIICFEVPSMTLVDKV